MLFAIFQGATVCILWLLQSLIETSQEDKDKKVDKDEKLDKDDDNKEEKEDMYKKEKDFFLEKFLKWPNIPACQIWWG